jgi:uncharacterized protein
MPGMFRGINLLAMILALASPIGCLASPYEDGKEAFRNQDYDRAIALWRPLADAGDAHAQARLAELYLGGLGVRQDYDRAYAYASKAADRGVARGEYILATMYRDGKGVEKDVTHAIALFRQAADQDFAWAQYALGLIYFVGEGARKDLVEAYQWVALAAGGRDEDPTAQTTASYLLDQVGGQLTPDQMQQAKQRVQNWKPAPSH